MSSGQKRVMVLGGGLAGASAALNLARAGVAVDLVEKASFIGGHAVNITCKALDECQHCNGCLVDPRLEAVQEHPGITIHRGASLTKAARVEGGFELELVSQPAYLDPQTCTGCGQCQAECPEEGAILAAPYAGDSVQLAIDPAACLYFKDRQSKLCQEVCPVEAIDFGREPQSRSLQAQAVILATGFVPYDPAAKPRLGYGRNPAVLSAMDLEEMLRSQGRALRPSDGQAAESVAFIQCVGSREREGHNYCSRICCAYALRLGRALHKKQGAEVSVFHMDLQSFGEDFDAYLAQTRQELNLVRAMPYEVMKDKSGRTRVVYQPAPGQEAVYQAFDLVVLSPAMVPALDDRRLLQGLGLASDEHGFMTPAQGVFVAGAAAGPMDLRESAASAGRASQEVLDYLEAR